MTFNNANAAFEYLYDYILDNGKEKCGTKYLKNIAFTIDNPLDSDIECDFRNWNKEYADYEWDWYLSGNNDATEIAKRAKIWAMCQDDNGCVNSNYGYQWNRGNKVSQIDYIINELTNTPQSRRAVISIYDGKETELYSKDTPCTLSISFSIEDGKLDMNVHMRSNDLVFGFCNDQYCFAKLQQLIANKLNVSVGTYYHSVVDLHIYSRHFDMKNKKQLKK